MATETPEPKEGDVLPGAEVEEIRPSWIQILPFYLSLVKSGNPKAQDRARMELERVCVMADNLIAAVDLLLEARPHAPAEIVQKIDNLNQSLPR